MRALQHVWPRGTIKLLRIAGIRIDVDASWFFMLFLLIFWISGDFKDALHSSSNVAYVTTVITAVLFFGSVIMHEMGHALVARHEGIHVQRIALFRSAGRPT